MPSILDYLDNPQFLNSVISGDTTDSFGPNSLQPQQPPPPPPEIMAQAPKQFGPGGAVDGGTGPADSFAARFSPGPEPISMPTPSGPPMPRPRPVPMPQPKPQNFGPTFADRAEPAQAAIAGGDFDPQGRNYTDFGLSPSAGSAMAFAGAPQTRNGFPYEEPQGAPSAALPETGPMPRPNPLPRDGDISVNRTPRNGMSLDDMQMSRPAPVGAPMDIRSAAQSGQPAPRIDRARLFGNFMASLGHGLTAVGNQKPGTNGAAAFAGGAGGAITGGVENERHNLDRDEKGMDRAERGRERDQTFDYQNRTLAQNTKYHDDLVKQHALDRDQKANAERYTPVGQDADGRIIYSDRNHPGREILGENRAVSRTGAGNQGGANERLARIIQAEHGKDADGNFKITMEEANNRARSAPKDSADLLRRETLARRDLKEHEDRRRKGDPVRTLEDFRRDLGLPPAPGSKAAPSPSVRGDPDRNMPLPPPSGPPTPTPTAPGKITPFFTPQNPPPALPGPGMAPPGTQAPPPTPVPGPIAGRNLTAGGPGPTPTPAPPFSPGPLPPAVTAGPALSRPPLPGPGAGAPPSVPPAATPPGIGMNATKSEIRSGPTPPRPPSVPPGSQYSPSRNAWRAPDGTIIPGAPPQ